MADSLTLAQARALWWHKQALAGTTPGALAGVLGSSGWLRTLGGTDVYLAARARRPGMKRAELDAAVQAGELRVHPAVRGCIYLVPSSVVPDLLALNAVAWRAQAEKDLARIGKTMAVVEGLAPAVLAALTEPMTPDAIRKALHGEIPSFGEAGKKVGLSSPLPLALRLLELAGSIERSLDGGRLDSERYLWRRTTGTLGAPAKGHDQRVARVIDAFLGFAAPATLAQLSAWSGRPQRELKAAIDRIDTVTVAVEGLGEAYARPADLAARPAEPRGIALVAFEDNYLVNHGMAAVTDPRHHAIEVDLWGSGKGPEPLGKASHVLSRSIVIDGLVAGFWEVDPRAGTAVWTTFDPAPRALARELEQRTGEAARFLLDELGHAKVFSLDTMDDVQRRADRISAIAAIAATAARAGKLPAPRAAGARAASKSSAKQPATRRRGSAGTASSPGPRRGPAGTRRARTPRRAAATPGRR
ncbi:MAG TPA: crosslink repair DNA glycosylase YcaQ family protein [Kofleriaceae bacterium]|nr:crosslink repair DNA glycosylase YcaQ family protein [Kofleriaceae bacterium]